MQSKSFTNKDTKFKKIKQILPSVLIDECYAEYTNPEYFNKHITNPKILKDIELALNSSLNLFCKDLRIATNINIVDTLKQQTHQNNVSTLALLTVLKNYGLSLGQANYIAISSTQGGIGKSNILNHALSKIGLDATLLIHRLSSLSQIIIDNNKNAYYIGGQVILFDVPQAKYSEVLHQGVGIENYLLHQSYDRVILYITVSLGQLGQDLTKKSFAIRIDAASEGETGNKILEEFNSIKSACKNIDPEEVLSNYIEFSEQTLYRDKMHERHELIALIAQDEEAGERKGSNNVPLEDLATLLTINAINVPNKKKVELILKQEGADANCRDQNQNTILHLIALERGDCEVAQLLLNYGANPNIINEDGDTPLHIAFRNNYREMITLLSNNGADLNIINTSGHLCNFTEQNINISAELQEFKDFIFARESCNISLHSVPIMDLEIENTAIASITTTYFSSWNLFKKNKSSANQCLMSASNKTTNNARSTWYKNEDTTNLVEVMYDLFYTVTSDNILQLKEMFINASIKNKQEEFLCQLNLTLSANQLHHLNTLIMQTMHQLLPEEDTTCLLRSSEDKIFHDLLLLEAKRHDMVVSLPNNINDELNLPQIPEVLLDLYATLKDYFYNQANRHSQEPLEQRIAKSIHWLFINPLISKHCAITQNEYMLALKLLQFPGKYTELLIQNNIADKVIYKSNKTSQILTNKEINKCINNILQIYVPDFTNLIVDEVSYKSKININQLNQDALTNVILGHFQMHCNLQILLLNTELILDEISNFIKELYGSKATHKHNLLSIFLHNFISKMDLENQIITQEDQEAKYPVTNPTSPFDVTLHIKKFTEDNNYKPLVEIKYHEEFIQHLQKYYGTFIGPQLVDYVIRLYSHLGEEGNKYILEDIQYDLVILGSIPIIDWLVQYEGLDPILLLDNAIYHYALPSSDQSTKDRMRSIIKHILTDDVITNYFTLKDAQELLNQFRITKKEALCPLDLNNVSTILSFIDLVITGNWIKETIDLLYSNDNNPTNNVEDVSLIALEIHEYNMANTH